MPDWLDGAVTTPIVARLPLERRCGADDLSALSPGRARGRDRDRHRALAASCNRTRIGMMIRAGVDDRAMLSASGVNVHVVFAIVFAIGAGLAGFAGVVGGSALSIAPGEDVRYLLASLVVVIVGGMGSITGAAIGALLIGLAEQIGLAYFPTYGIVLTFVIMVAVLAFRPQGIMGRAGMSLSRAAIRRQYTGARRFAQHRSGHWSRLAIALLVYPARRDAVLHLPDRRLFADPRHDRAVADGARRLWRHGQPRADERRRRSPATWSRSSATIARASRARLAVVDRRAAGARHRRRLRDRRRAARDPHRRASTRS